MTVRVTSNQQATAADARYTSAQVGFIPANDRNALAAAARALGMSATGQRDTYQAGDGSWIYMDANGRVQRGVGGTQWVGTPANAQRAAQQQRAQPARPAATTNSNGLVNVQGAALTRLPMLTSGYAAGVASLVAAGFQQSGNAFIHPDGSRVDWNGNTPSLSYNGIPLARLQRWW